VNCARRPGWQWLLLLTLAVLTGAAQWHAVNHAEQHALEAVQQSTHHHAAPNEPACQECLAMLALGPSPLADVPSWSALSLHFELPAFLAHNHFPARQHAHVWPRAPPRSAAFLV
jgi:hypothetical protein